MSWILRSKRQTAIFVVVAAILGCLFLLHYYMITVLSIVFIIAAHYLNQQVYKKIRKPLERLGAKREVENIDRLVIGDMCAEANDDKKSSLIITAPNRSLYASLQILYHVGSVLTNSGTVVIVAPSRSVKNRVTIFDAPFLSLVSSLEEGRNRSSLLYKYPLFISPGRSIRYLLGSRRKTAEAQCPEKGIVDYCVRKGFKLKFLA